LPGPSVPIAVERAKPLRTTLPGTFEAGAGKCAAFGEL